MSGQDGCQIRSLTHIVAHQVPEAVSGIVDALEGGDGHGKMLVDEVHGPLVHDALGIGKVQRCGAGMLLDQSDRRLQVREQAGFIFLPGLSLQPLDAGVLVGGVGVDAQLQGPALGGLAAHLPIHPEGAVNVHAAGDQGHHSLVPE